MTLQFVTLKTVHKTPDGKNEDRNVTIAYEKYFEITQQFNQAEET